jgi:hypothetical protein
MGTRSAFRQVVTAFMVSTVATVTLAASPPAATPAGPSKETREKMALLHEQMATCLRSDRAMADCRDEMRKNCQATVGERGCPMMGMHSHMGQQAPSPPPSPK